MQFANMGLLREGWRGRRELALTFDDGPDPVTTPAVLDALREAGARATFFVLAEQAEAHPELIARMLEGGHEVAAHAEKHVHAWIRTPWGSFLDVVRAVRRVGAVTGGRVNFHRPPHGAYTLATVLGQRVAGVRGVHWSVNGKDWRANQTPQQVRERLLLRAGPGSIVVLHDAGRGAVNTVPMLPELLREWQGRGYTFKTVAELQGATPVDGAALRRRAFIALDYVFDRVGRIQPTAGRADNLFRTGYAAFPFAGITLADGTSVPRGAPCAEFHVNNPLMVDLGINRPAIRQAQRDYPLVAADLLRRPDLRGAEYIFCISAVSPVMAVMGFETYDLPPAAARRLRLWAQVMRWGFAGAPKVAAPRLSILSRAAFLAQYGNALNDAGPPR
ncbi:polysaccharide deacetylase family protein [Deinococcus arenicola]|uniref:Polysaccharide deacetylase family protein n=1 Tax=Deinococcus arenicola TaxID=2994950 RepID=A0ABU4DTJ9_9DEIO|nr:polysaccharide deacetylase family protein [Deinococcus sp. ZS9-10]MDV6375761.1 polysaccharide deacetylase family protein [Deinococcus sp. ZS9-10]